MKKDNRRIAYEYTIISNARFYETDMVDDPKYGKYHANLMGSYSDLELIYFRALGAPNLHLPEPRTRDEFSKYIMNVFTALINTDLELTNEQKRELFRIRKLPLFKKLMGETALQKREELEEVLGSKITSRGIIVGDETGLHRATKTEEQLDQELEAHHNKLSELLASGAITEEQYDTYSDQVFYIYDYYASISRGEQFQFRKMTNEQYDQVQRRANENGWDFDVQFAYETEALQREQYDIYDLQEAHNQAPIHG